MFSGDGLVVTRPGSMLLPHIGIVFDTRNLVFDAEDCFLVVNVLALFTLGDDFSSLATIGLENTDARCLRRVTHVETIGRRLED